MFKEALENGVEDDDKEDCGRKMDEDLTDYTSIGCNQSRHLEEYNAR